MRPEKCVSESVRTTINIFGKLASNTFFIDYIFKCPPSLTTGNATSTGHLHLLSALYYTDKRLKLA